jgi:sugar lactone lactonase YvrE/acetyl esterase/lipase
MTIRILALLVGWTLTLSAIAAEPLVDPKLEKVGGEFGLPDGPAWDGGGLYVPDVKGQKLYRYVPRTKKWQVVLPESGRISASFYNLGQLYLSDNGNSRIGRLVGKEIETVAAHDPNETPPSRPNDLVVDKNGGIYYTLTRQGHVIYVSPDGKAEVAIEKIETPNGLILSPDGMTLYVASYVPKKIWGYVVGADGKVSDGRVFAAMDEGPEKGADGMTIDRAGNVYCAGPKHVWVWSPSSNLLAKIKTPTRPINCAFGDADMRSLYITCFDGVYRQRMNTYGRPPHPPSKPEDHGGNTNRPVTTVPDDVAAHLDVVYARHGDRKLVADIFVPQKAGPHPAIVVVHGGGWLKGDKTKFRALAVTLAERGYVTAAIEYRLGYEAPFPGAIQDCTASVRFLRYNAKKYRIDPERIGAVGGSAGGHLVGLMATAPDVPEFRGIGGKSGQSARLQAAIVMAGPMQMATGSVAERSRKQPKQSNSNQWLRKTIDEAPDLYKLAAPYQHLDKNTPPMLFMVGEFDHPERNEPTRKKLRELGVWTDLKVYKGGKHGCWNQLPWFADMVDDMDGFFGDKLRK